MPRIFLFLPALFFISLTAAVPNRSAAQSTPSDSQQTQQEHSKPAAHDEKHYQDVNKHGDMAMGFSHLKTTHHFGLTRSGGFIEVQANDPKDMTSKEQIRTHLEHISKAFKAGDFEAPELTHGLVPPGVPTMQRLKNDIEYRYAETETGGKVIIRTGNAEALKAVHDFLRFQIADHRTGDSTKVSE